MKRSVTGGETKVAAHKGKALVLRWLGATQRLYLERRIRREFRFNKSLIFPFFLLFKNSKQSIHYRHKTNNISFKIINIVSCKTRWEITPVFVCDI